MFTTQKSYHAKTQELSNQWYLVDASGQTLGRLAANIARVLRGKHRPQFTPNINTGEGVVVINAGKIVVTGKKMTDKIYDRASQYPNGRHTRTYEEQVALDPTFPLTAAVKGMLQHNTLGHDMSNRLRVYTGPEHLLESQHPVKITFGQFGEVIRADS
jgi:large subunit ribosomal protein L13